jgi:hypothetical protein
MAVVQVDGDVVAATVFVVTEARVVTEPGGVVEPDGDRPSQAARRAADRTTTPTRMPRPYERPTTDTRV